MGLWFYWFYTLIELLRKYFDFSVQSGMVKITQGQSLLQVLIGGGGKGGSKMFA